MSSEDLREIICQGVKLTMNEKGEMTGSSLYKTEIIAKLFGVGPRRIQQMTALKGRSSSANKKWKRKSP